MRAHVCCVRASCVFVCSPTTPVSGKQAGKQARLGGEARRRPTHGHAHRGTTAPTPLHPRGLVGPQMARALVHVLVGHGGHGRVCLLCAHVCIFMCVGVCARKPVCTRAHARVRNCLRVSVCAGMHACIRWVPACVSVCACMCICVCGEAYLPVRTPGRVHSRVGASTYVWYVRGHVCAHVSVSVCTSACATMCVGCGGWLGRTSDPRTLDGKQNAALGRGRPLPADGGSFA